MKDDAVSLAAGLALNVFSSQKSAIPRQLRITPWQMHSWKKRIIKLRKRSDARDETQTVPKGADSLYPHVSFAHQCHHART